MSTSTYAHPHDARCGRLRWTPPELVAMILGFIFFFPVGLAILFWKIWQSKSAYSRDFGQFAHEKWGGIEQRCGFSRVTRDVRARWPTSGNTAFDDWRKIELERIEEERRKIYEAEKAFSDYLDGLRRARDREEFERFMASRSQPGPSEPPAHS